MIASKTKIIATIGPASEKVEILEKLIKSGIDAARLNFSHGSQEEQESKITKIRKISKKLKKPSREGQSQLGELLSQVEETLSGLRIIKAFNAEQKMNGRFHAHNEKLRRTMRKLARRQQLAHPVSEFLGTSIIAMVVWFGGSLILKNETSITGEKFIFYLAVFYSIINPAKAFSQAWYTIQRGMASMERIDKILQAEDTITEPENPVKIEAFKE